MGFFTPWFLAGVAAVGLPVWLHLLKRHKTDPKAFPSLMFFEFRETSSVKHRKLDYLLLFALRALMLFLLALLFASPFIRRSAASLDGKRLTIVAIDRSFSMRDADHMARAKTQAQQVLSALKPGDQAQRGGFAAARGAEQGQYFAAPEFERDVVDRAKLAEIT